MKTMEIYFGDLTEEAQQTFIEIFGEPEEMNLDIAPLFIYEQEEKEIDNEGVGLLNACLVEKKRRENEGIS